MTEVPTPLTFNRNLVIWVDDQPHNNKVIAAEMQQKDVEVIQLTSTEMAKKWTTEFGWLLNWMDVKFKVISDMVRFEEGEANYEAGIDLLEHFYNIKGYST